QIGPALEHRRAHEAHAADLERTRQRDADAAHASGRARNTRQIADDGDHDVERAAAGVRIDLDILFADHLPDQVHAWGAHPPRLDRDADRRATVRVQLERDGRLAA